MTPHVVKEIQDTVIDSKLLERRYPSIEAKYYTPIAEGMRAAVTGGTCRGAAIPGIEVCGKTGTAQNPHGNHHAVFMGFAPYDNPKIAIAVFVECGGYGATYGVPIGSLVMEKYLTGTISPGRKATEELMLNSKVYYAPPKKK